MAGDALYYQIGGFSRVNDALFAAFEGRGSEFRWVRVDVERDVVGASAWLRARATAEALARYGMRIAAGRQPPRDFFPRLPCVLEAVRRDAARRADPGRCAFVFQTQSLFSARHPGLPHFLYTDHTYLANRRYAGARRPMPVAMAWREMERELYAAADGTFVSSAFAAESVVEDYGVPEERVHRVGSGRNILPPANAPDARRTGRVILFGGVDWERKGGPETVRAFGEVKRRVPEAELWIAGCNPPVGRDGIRVLGRLDADGLAEAYAGSDIFCLPSRMDPSAGVLAEAAGFGLPVVATPVGGNPERVVDGETGILCGPDGLADALVRLLRDADLRARMGEAGRRLADERFTWAAVADSILLEIRRRLHR